MFIGVSPDIFILSYYFIIYHLSTCNKKKNITIFLNTIVYKNNNYRENQYTCDSYERVLRFCVVNLCF